MFYSNAMEDILPEYPRPTMKRSNWLSLNGAWDCSINSGSYPTLFENSIIVPFAPESKASGLSRITQRGETLWYHTTFTLDLPDLEKSILLHFGGVDEYAEVYINHVLCGSHQGGYEAFTCNISNAVVLGENHIIVKVTDSTGLSGACRGKQSLRPSGIWYTSMSGIWQTVWLESVPNEYIESVIIQTDFDSRSLSVLVRSASDTPVTLITNGRIGVGNSNSVITIEHVKANIWTPDSPTLNSITIRMGEDSVESYYAFRKCEVKTGEDGIPKFFLNNEQLFLAGVLDQGYWPDSLYTPPSDLAIVTDILQAKKLGFNMLRKHAKVEPERWYWHCDRLGMLVWQDIPNGEINYNPLVQFLPLIIDCHFKDSMHLLFRRAKAASRKLFTDEIIEIINQLKHHPSIVTWVPFNEGWGQFDSRAICNIIKSIDSRRPIDHASGWHDQGIGDYKSSHVYFKKYRYRQDRHHRAVILSEFGGYSLSPSDHDIFSYKKYKDPIDFMNGLEQLFQTEILPAAKQGLCGYVYTQLTDVETEENGLLTSDRKTIKVDHRKFKELIIPRVD